MKSSLFGSFGLGGEDWGVAFCWNCSFLVVGALVEAGGLSPLPFFVVYGRREGLDRRAAPLRS